MRFRNCDLLSSPIVPSLVFFALPILFSSLFQQLYNAADTTIVGNYLGDEALAAVGASVAVFELVVGFDIVFITSLGMGVKSAAVATVLAQFISVSLSVAYIINKAKVLVPELKHFKYNKAIYAELLTQGLSMGFMSSIVATGSVILQTSVNAMGVSIIGAQTTARRIFFFFTRPLLAIATALMTFVSQNFGAQQYDRIRTAVKSANYISIAVSVVMGIFLYLISEPLIRLLSGSDNVELIESAKLYIYVSSAMYAVLGVLFNLRNSLQGIGRKLQAVASSVIELISKIVFVIFIIPKLGYPGVIITEPVIWVFMTAQLWWSWKRWTRSDKF